jgi:hypothetical protein
MRENSSTPPRNACEGRFAAPPCGLEFFWICMRDFFSHRIFCRFFAVLFFVVFSLFFVPVFFARTAQQIMQTS